MKELTHFDYFKAWLMLLALNFVIVVVSGVASTPAVAIWAMAGASERQIEMAPLVVRYAVLLPLSYLALRFVFRKFLIPKLLDAQSPVGPR